MRNPEQTAGADRDNLPTSQDQITTEASIVAVAKAKRPVIAWFRRIIIVTVIGVMTLPLWLAGAAFFLIRGERELQATVALPFGGVASYEMIQAALGDSIEYVGVIDYRPSRLVQLKLLPSHRETMTKQLDQLGVPLENRWVFEPEVAGLADLISRLEELMQQDENFTCDLVVNAYGTRRMKNRVRETASAETLGRIRVVIADPYEFSAWNWWLDSHGRRTVVTEWIDYLAYSFSNRNKGDAWEPRTREEFRASAVGDAG